ncbi:MAG: FAD-binding oxidoreductase [Patescibacteria group bacterium]|nr:FAD-binding oxidoreductase [Patescibacteria group bacterium]
MVHKDAQIELTVKQLRQDQSEYKTVIFERPVNFIYEAGDWIDVDFADTSYRGGKTYTLSSSPSEGGLAISFRVGVSPFKKKLQTVQAGEKMYISAYGNDYGFHLKDNRTSVLIAGGIGIAPFRSMLKEMYDTRSNDEVQLMYLNKTQDFLFKQELDDWRQRLPNVSIEYIMTQELKRKERKKLLLSLIKDAAHNYYIAGPRGMVQDTLSFLRETGVAAKDIRIDDFGSY